MAGNAKKQAKKKRRPGAGGARPGAGRKAWQPTDAIRRTVKAMVGYGATEREIAAYLGIARNTVAKALKDELQSGRFAANMRVAESLFQQAVGQAAVVEVYPDGVRRTIQEAVPPNVTAGIWWTKTQMGWKEIQKHELTGPDGGPIESKASVTLYLPKNGRD